MGDSQQELQKAIRTPAEQDARVILRQTLGKEVRTIRRFPTGLAHYVYDVVTQEGEPLVVRLTRSDSGYVFEAALYWYGKMRDIGVPMATLFYSSTEAGEDGFPVMIMERLAGTDLNFAYPELTSAQKRGIAEKIVAIQRSVATLPLGSGYGFASSEDDPDLWPRWVDVLYQNIERSRGRMRQIGVVDLEIVDRIKALIHQHEDYFATVKPTCFLDDTTTKNVIIDKGVLSGIVDVDAVAYGDPLLPLALTRMSLLSSGYDREYTDYWAELYGLDGDQRKALDLYTAMFSVDFLAEKGHAFNKEAAAPVEQEEIDHLIGVFNSLTSEL